MGNFIEVKKIMIGFGNSYRIIIIQSVDFINLTRWDILSDKDIRSNSADFYFYKQLYKNAFPNIL